MKSNFCSKILVYKAEDMSSPKYQIYAQLTIIRHLDQKSFPPEKRSELLDKIAEEQKYCVDNASRVMLARFKRSIIWRRV